MRLLTSIIPAALALMLTGCGPPAPPSPPKIGYYVATPEDVAKIHQVAVLPLVSGRECEDIARDMTETLVQGLQTRRLFQLDMVKPDEAVAKMIDLGRREPLTLAELSAIRKELRCDAILIGSLLTFEPYPRMKMALRLRLLDLKRGKLLWGVDHVWDTTDQSLEDRMEDYFDDRVAEGFQPMNREVVKLSPREFEKFVAYEVARTLPPVRGEPSKLRVSKVRRVVERTSRNLE